MDYFVAQEDQNVRSKHPAKLNKKNRQINVAKTFHFQKIRVFQTSFLRNYVNIHTCLFNSEMPVVVIKIHLKVLMDFDDTAKTLIFNKYNEKPLCV